MFLTLSIAFFTPVNPLDLVTRMWSLLRSPLKALAHEEPVKLTDLIDPLSGCNFSDFAPLLACGNNNFASFLVDSGISGDGWAHLFDSVFVVVDACLSRTSTALARSKLMLVFG